LISSYSGDGTLLPRTLAEICENVRDFIVLEEAGYIIGCGAMHLYGQHLAEIRSITVDKRYQKRGGGELLVQSLMSEARKHEVSCICLFTRTPEFFGKLGFSVAQREPSRQDQQRLPMPALYNCDEVAMVKGELPRFAIPAGTGKLAGEAQI
jgi:amino-acid N-acetyltransferase